MTISIAEARRELRKRQYQERKPWDPIAALFDYQRPIFLDETPDRAVVGTRQFGKSRIGAVILVDGLITHPTAESAYVDMDILHAGKVVWREIDSLLDEYQIDAKVVQNELHFDTGAIGYVFSGQESEVKKLQGLKYADLIVDEAQEAAAIDKILTLCKPALMRHNGRVTLMGIPGRVAKIGAWWHATEGKNKHLYGQHRGTFWDNTALTKEAKERLYDSERKRLGERNPDFLRHWRGLWPELDNALRVYHYDPDTNGYDGDAPEHAMYTLGLDPGGVRDSEAVVVVGHGNANGIAYAVDEEVSEKKEGGDWDDTADRVGPLQEKWNCHVRYYDWGSAHKDALTLIWRKDRQILMTGVPSKDPYEESKRINTQFAQKKLFIRRGSKLEQDLLYTTWDPETLGGGGQKPQYSKAYKQDAADALRCAMWGVYGYVPPAKALKVQLSDVETERLRILNGDAYKKKPAQRQDKYRPPGVTPLNQRVDRNGRVLRGY